MWMCPMLKDNSRKKIQRSTATIATTGTKVPVKISAPLGGWPESTSPYKRGDLIEIADGTATYVGRVRGLNSFQRYEVDIYNPSYGRSFLQIYFNSDVKSWMAHHQRWPIKVSVFKGGMKEFNRIRLSLGIVLK